MSGFAAWVAGPSGTLAFGVLVLALGMILGWIARGQAQDRRELDVREEREANRAARQFRAMRDPALAIEYRPRSRTEAMASRTHPVYRQRRTRTAAFLNPPELHHEAIGLVSRFLDADLAREAWLAHTEQAMNLTRPPGQLAAEFDVDAEIARMHDETDRFLARVVAGYRSPYAPGELEAGQ